MYEIFAVVILCVSLVSASCPAECQCPPEPPRCAAGISLMLDSCGCCKVCARQLFEDCSETEPCDRIKGLECNFGGRYGSVRGICRAKSDGITCEYNNKIYQNGETFRPNCKHMCTCMDGAVGCVSLCPRELTLPNLGCAKPRLVKVPGQCCEQLVCPEDVKMESASVKKHSKKHHKERMFEEEDLTNKNELGPVWGGEAKSLPAFRSLPMGQVLAREVKCLSQTTDWSPCSKSCGTGVSTRMTNSNPQCKLVKETRICEIRPCNQKTKSGQKCNPIEKASRPVKLSHAGCRSLKRFQPRYCGSCSDGECCTPHYTQTLPVRFRCKNGQTLSRMVMMIQSCKCDLSCSGAGEKQSAFDRLFNDIHKPKM